MIIVFTLILITILFQCITCAAEATEIIALTPAPPPEIFVSSSAMQWVSLLASVFTVVAVFVAVSQLISSNLQHREDAKRSSADRAIDIGKLFQSQLIMEMSFNTLVLGFSGQSKLYEKCDKLHCDTLRFTQEEFLELFGMDAETAYEGCQKNITPLLLSMAAEKYDELLQSREQETATETELFKTIQDAKAKHEFDEKRMNLLNTLEWVAMLINTRVADEAVIYQSLHQVFLRYVRLEYPAIALMNSDKRACDQYYTNIIQLYRLWEGRWLEACVRDHVLSEERKAEENRQKAKQQARRDQNVKYAPHVSNRS
ncbi:MAG: hypothetical protein PHI98_07720 [Eubacteriales bacterium]|nr:hypothetical protein [Eubacteriales bacterium]